MIATSRHVCSGHVVDRDGVGSAQRVEAHFLNVVEVHDDIGDVACEQGAPAVGGERDVLGNGGAVEVERVEAVLALEGVVVVARVPDEGVVAEAHQRSVVAVAAVDQVVALAADENVGTETAVHRQLHGACLEAGRVDHVVATKPVQRQPVAGFVEEHVRRGLQAEHLNSAGIAGDAKHVVTVGRIRP